MSAFDDSSPPVDKRFRDLLEAAGEEAVERAKTETLSIERATATLDTLLEEAGGAAAVTAKSGADVTTTQDAMESLFIDGSQQHSGHPDVLVGLDENQGISDMGLVEEDVPPVIAGAERPDTQTQPVKRLDDGVDFWGELESIESGSED